MKEQIIICVGIILVAVFTFAKEWKIASENQKISLVILLIIAIGGATIACIYGIAKEKQEQENVALLKRIDTLNQNHSDTLRLNLKKSSHIIDLQNQTLDSASDLIHRQAELKDAYIKISTLQDEKITEMLGGQIPPTVNIVAQTIAERLYNKTTNNWDSADFFVGITFTLLNESKYHLKAVVAKVQCENYNNIRKVNKISETSANLVLYDKNAELYGRNDTSLATLPAHTLKKAFYTKVPIGLNEYMFTLMVEWSNGYYYSHIFLTANNSVIDPKSYLLKLKKIEFFAADGKQIKVKYNFFSNNVLH